MDAALRVITRKDAAALSILELAHEAQVSHGTVYNDFRTREEIVDTAALRLADDLSGQQSRMFAGLEEGAGRLTLAVRRAGQEHDRHIAYTVLRGLGATRSEAERLVARPFPALR